MWKYWTAFLRSCMIRPFLPVFNRTPATTKMLDYEWKQMMITFIGTLYTTMMIALSHAFFSVDNIFI